MIFKSQIIFKKQKKILKLCLLGIIGVSLVLGIAGSRGKKSQPTRTKSPVAELPTDKVNPEEIWMSRIEGEGKAVRQELDYLKGLVLQNKATQEEKDKENIELRKEIAKLKREMREKPQQMATVVPPVISSVPSFGRSTDDLSGLIIDQVIEVDVPVPAVFCPPLVEYIMIEPERKVSHVRQSIPAGTTVRALLVSSVDAPVGIHCPANPQPIKLRILDNGHLPKGVEVELKGGIVIGSAYGDLSSERVFIRLERLTQVRADGEFVETQIAGFVSGEDGRYGVRGLVVDKAAKMVLNATASGLLSGASQFLQATVNYQNVHNATKGLPNNLAWDLIKEGSLCGCTNSAEILSEYFIKKAEQVQPVIEVAAGRIVDITFTQGAEVGDLHTHERLETIRQDSRRIGS
jgi:conjugal transfer pilus assembly protein TraB